MVDGLDRILPALLPLAVVLFLGMIAVEAADALRPAPVAVTPSGVAATVATAQRGAAGLFCKGAQRRSWQDSGGLCDAANLERSGARCGLTRRGRPANARDPQANEGSLSSLIMVTGGGSRARTSGPGGLRTLRGRIPLSFPLRA